MRPHLFIAALVITIFYALITKLDDLGNISITYEVKTENRNLTQLHWRIAGTQTVKHLNKSIQAFPAANTVTFTIDAATDKITIVPVTNQDAFSLSNIKIYRPGLFIDIPLLSTQPLELSSTTEVQNVEQISSDRFPFKSQTINPIFTFNIDARFVYIKYVTINFLTLLLLLYWGRLVYSRLLNSKSTPTAHTLTPDIFIFILVPCLYLFSKLSIEFNNPLASLQVISWFTLIVYLGYLCVVALKKSKINVFPVIILALLIFILLPDVSYKLSFIDHKPNSNKYTPIYHWRLSNSMDQTLTQSGHLYKEDMKEIERLVNPSDSFISDEATSYYALSFLPLYPTTAKPHHGGSGKDYSSPFVSYEFLKYLCGPDELYNDTDIVEFIGKKSALHKQRNWPDLKYVLLNKDTQNRFVRWQCLTANNPNTVRKVQAIGKLIYQGEYIDLYEIDINK